jgi:hypothetical protein
MGERGEKHAARFGGHLEQIAGAADAAIRNLIAIAAISGINGPHECT